jgi:hypothetical protein
MHDASYEHYEQSPRYGRGPEVFYGYCCDSRRMRMMDYSDYVRNMRRAYSDMYGAMYRHAQGSMNSWMAAMPGWHEWWKHRDCGCGQPSHGYGGYPWSHQECGCHGDHHDHDCHCSCCIRGADAVEYVHCGEQRLIPLLFENDTRRERDVKLELGGFATASGQDLGWQAGFSESAFKLPPCGRHTVLLNVSVDCGKFGGGGDAAGNRLPSVDECKVGYATVRAEGCSVRPLVVAVAVLPNDCGAHKAPCGCGCCN